MKSTTYSKPLTFADLFAGIGGFRLGIENAAIKLNISVKCVFSSEIEKNARFIYEKNFKETPSGDITKIHTDNIRYMDILCGGFPCQAFSIAGKRRGFDDTRGTLFFEIARIARDKRPKILFLENVKGLLNHNRGRTFGTILCTLDELGYDVEWQVLNSKDFGVPQNRERVFIIGHLRGRCTKQIFPICGKTTATTRENSSTCIDSNYWKGIDNHGARTHIAICDSGQSRELQLRNILPPLRNGGGGCGQNNYIASAVLTPDRLEKRQNGRRFKKPDEPMFTLTAQDKHGVLIQTATGINLPSRGPEPRKDNNSCCLKAAESGTKNIIFDGYSRIRKLTPVECERLQSYPDGYTEGISDTARYKCIGNSVTVNVIEAIAEKILLAIYEGELKCLRNEFILKDEEKLNARHVPYVVKT